MHDDRGDRGQERGAQIICGYGSNTEKPGKTIMEAFCAKFVIVLLLSTLESSHAVAWDFDSVSLFMRSREAYTQSEEVVEPVRRKFEVHLRKQAHGTGEE